jgi:hypothetical protein
MFRFSFNSLNTISTVLSNSLLFAIFLSKSSSSLALTLDEVDEQDGENVEREPQQIKQGQRHKGRVGVQHVVLVDLHSKYQARLG